MIREKLKTKIKNLERSRPPHIKNDEMIGFTAEARELLDPWYDALFSSTIKPGPDHARPRTHESIWYKVGGDCLVTCAPQEFTPGGGLNLTSHVLGEVNVDVARCMIALLKKEGITID